MIRKIAIRAIAVLFMALGVNYLINLFIPLFDINADKSLNLAYLIYTSFLFHAGFNLYKLKESGRNLTLVLLSIRLIVNLGFSGWVAFVVIQGESFRLSFNIWNKNLSFADYRIEFALIMLIWCLAVWAMIAFLLQEKTKVMFSPEETPLTSQSQVTS